MIQIYSLEHARYEEPGYISSWLKEQGLGYTAIRLDEGDGLPDPNQVDLLIIMGGPMNIYEEDQYPWLSEEKRFIADVIKKGRPVLGICLGGQLIASVLGGKVTRSPVPEFGWCTVRRMHDDVSRNESNTSLPEFFPEVISVFQWHQDTFQIPTGAIQIYYGDSCQNQAFMYQSHVIALQFHPEMERETIRDFITVSQSELEEKGLFHLKDDILSRIDLCECGHSFIAEVMQYLLDLIPGRKSLSSSVSPDGI